MHLIKNKSQIAVSAASTLAGNTGFCSRQRGFNLIEVMVALFILAIGLLGMAGLQTKALEYNHNAYLRTQATNLAYDMIDRMRANRKIAIGSTPYYEIDFDSAATSAQACDVSCTPVQLATHDLNVWRGAIASMLPGGLGEIAIGESGGAYIAVVRVRFDDRANPNAGPVTIAISASL